MQETKSVIETIKDNYDQMFAAEKKVADFILKYPEKAVNSNVSELAHYSQVSEATVIRMCKHIGYEGYYQMRLFLSHDIGRKQANNLDVSPVKQSGKISEIKELFNLMAANIWGLAENLSKEKLMACADLINNCNVAHIVAVGNTSPLALDMGFRLGRSGVRATYNTIPEYFFNHINLADERDIVIAISISGTSKQVVQALELAKKKNLKTISITSSEYSPIIALSDYVLLSTAKNDIFEQYQYGKYSHLNEMAVIDALLYFVSSANVQSKDDIDAPEVMLSEYKL